MKVGEHEVPVISLPYLIATKLAADRPQDEIDLGQLLKRPELDYAVTREIVERLLGFFAAQRLDRLARGAGREDTPPEYGPEDS